MPSSASPAADSSSYWPAKTTKYPGLSDEKLSEFRTPTPAIPWAAKSFPFCSAADRVVSDESTTVHPDVPDGQLARPEALVPVVGSGLAVGAGVVVGSGVGVGLSVGVGVGVT